MNPPPKNELNNAIIGKWGGLGEERPVWEITNDSFYFKVTSKVTTYEIFKNDVIIHNPEMTTVLSNVRIIGDTLLFRDKMGDMEIRVFRIK